MKIYSKVIFMSLTILVIIAGVKIIQKPRLVLSKESIKKDFIKNLQNISLVTAYLIESKYDNIYINNGMDRGIIFANPYGDVSIDDLQVIDAIGILIKEGYEVIGKADNVIYFQRSSDKDFGSGIAYCIEGEAPSQSSLQFLTMTEPLAEPNWYYYEEDFNKYKNHLE